MGWDAELGPQMPTGQGWCPGLSALCPYPGTTWGTEDVREKMRGLSGRRGPESTQAGRLEQEEAGPAEE